MALDDSGWEYEVELIEIGEIVKGRVVNKRKSEREPSVQLALYFALTQRDKVEIILQKCTEVGVAEFVPMITERALVKDPRSVNGKFERWKAILREAAEQSQRGRIPLLSQVLSFQDALRTPARDTEKLIAWECEKQNKIRALLRNSATTKVALMIGPEGGFSEKEVELARSKGWKTITIGKRILRNETAAIVASALVIDHFS